MCVEWKDVCSARKAKRSRPSYLGKGVEGADAVCVAWKDLCSATTQ